MSVNSIDNLESAASIRAKLNELITIVNYYSSSQWPEGPGGGGGDPYTPPPGGGGGGYSSVTIYDSDGAIPYPVGHDTIMGACGAYPGAPKTIYYSKGGANVGASIEVGDSVWVDDAGNAALQSLKWYGYQDYGMNKAFYVSAGQVSEIQMCA